MLAQSAQTVFRPQLLAPEAPGNQLLGYRILDYLTVAIAVLDYRGILLLCNLRAKQLIQDSDLVDAREGRRLRFLDADADEKLKIGLCQFAQPNGSREGQSTTIVANGLDDDGLPLIATFIKLSNSPSTLLAILTESGRAPSEASLQSLMQAFHLTPAEQRLAHHLASGGCLNEAADLFGVSRHTVRNQLRSIFEKVGVQRQADLTRLMLAGSAHSGIAQLVDTLPHSRCTTAV